MPKLNLAAMIITLSDDEVREAITEWIEKRNLRPIDPKTMSVRNTDGSIIGQVPTKAFQFQVEAIEIRQGPYR